MIPLFQADSLVMAATDRAPAGVAEYRFVAPSGAVLGSMRESPNPSRRLGRLLSRHPGRGPALLRLADSEGNPILDVEKSRMRAFGRLEVRVSLADATALGSADGRVGFRPQVAFALRNPAGKVLADLRGGSGGQYQLLDPTGVSTGTLARQLSAQARDLPRGVWRSYKISFTPSADVTLRSLALATLASLDMRLL